MTAELRALIVCAHDDDEVIGCGGTIRKLADAGVAVTTLVLATGNEGYIRLADKDTIVARRREERTAAQAILGTSGCIAHAHHDFANLAAETVYREIMQAVRAVRPQVVFGHLPTDYLPHRSVSAILPDAVWQAGWQCSLDLGEPWAVDRLYQFPILDFLSRPSHLVDVTDTLPAKLAAMDAYASQHEVVAGVLDQIEAKARAYGSLVGVRYAEAFSRSPAIPIAVAQPVDLLTSTV